MRSYSSNGYSFIDESLKMQYNLLCAAIRKTNENPESLISIQHNPEEIKRLFIQTINDLKKKPYCPSVQNKRILNTCGDAIAILRTDGELESIRENHLAPIIPFCAEDTKDSEEGRKILETKVCSGDALIEDGCGNGQHLLSLLQNLNKKGIEVNALGTDISEVNIAIADLAKDVLGLGEACDFAPGHALHRSSGKEIWGEGRQIVIAYRLIPCFSINEMNQYFKKLEKDLAKGDLWCGSIALPQGALYERHINNKQLIAERKIALVPSSDLGEKTFHFFPDFGLTEEELANLINRNFEEISVTKEDVCKTVSNTYLTQVQFERLVSGYGFRVQQLIPVSCPKSERVVALIERKGPAHISLL